MNALPIIASVVPRHLILGQITDPDQPHSGRLQALGSILAWSITVKNYSDYIPIPT